MYKGIPVTFKVLCKTFRYHLTKISLEQPCLKRFVSLPYPNLGCPNREYDTLLSLNEVNVHFIFFHPSSTIVRAGKLHRRGNGGCEGRKRLGNTA